MLLEHEEPYTVVKSRHLGVFQHDPYTWAVQGRQLHLSGGTQQRKPESGPHTEKIGWPASPLRTASASLDSLYQAFEDTKAQELEDLAQPKRLYALIQGLVHLGRGHPEPHPSLR